MALTGHFLDFQEEVARVRGNMIAEIYSMTHGGEDIRCKDGDFAITRKDGDYTIETVSHSSIDDKTYLKTDNGTVFDVTELSTDDLVALYEFLFGVLFPDES